MCPLVSIEFRGRSHIICLMNSWGLYTYSSGLLQGRLTAAGTNGSLVTLKGLGRFIPKHNEPWQSTNHVYDTSRVSYQQGPICHA